MKFGHIVCFCSLVVAFAVAELAMPYAVANENTRLVAKVSAGPLEISMEFAELEYSLNRDRVGAVDQVDAVSFTVTGIVVNDLNGDGKGWRLSASPEPLVNGLHSLPVGSVAEFVDFENLDGISTVASGDLVSSRSDGVVGFETDYSVSYTVPSFAPEGTYQGVVSFSIFAE